VEAYSSGVHLATKRSVERNLWVTDLASAQAIQAGDMDYNGWSRVQKLIFLNALISQCEEHQHKLPLETLEAMDAQYFLTNSGNAEIRNLWVMLCVKCGTSYRMLRTWERMYDHDLHLDIVVEEVLLIFRNARHELVLYHSYLLF
jgi:hypothetical protein